MRDTEDEFMEHIDPDLNYFQSNWNNPNIGNVFNVEQFCLAVGNDSSGDIFVLSMNIRSLHKHKDELMSLLSALIIEPDVIILTETWLNKNDCDFASLEGYQVFHTIREDSRSGGVSVYCKVNYNCYLHDEISVCNLNVETCCVTVDFGNFKTNFVGVYRPHSGTIQQFIEEITRIVDDGEIKNKGRLCMVGDFNINLLDNSIEANINLMSFMQSNHLVPLIKRPTRYPANLDNTLPTLLDHIWVNFLDSSLSGVLDIDITDHCPVFVCVPVPPSRLIDDKVKVTFRDQSNDNMIKIRDELFNYDWNLDQFSDLNEKLRCFSDSLNYIYVKNCPLKVKFISRKRLGKPWISNYVMENIKLKSHYFTLYKRGVISKNMNNYYKNRCNSIIRQAKRNYFHSYFNKYKHDMKKYWAGIKRVIGQDIKCNRRQIKSIVVDGRSIADEKGMACAFNEHFSTVATKLESILPPPDDVSPSSIVPFNFNSFYLYPVTPLECEEIILKLKNTSYGQNKMSARILKFMSPLISSTLSELINESFNVGIFPDELKLATITPIFKKGDPTKVENYRPISILPLLSKIYEKAMANRMVKFISKYSLITPNQFGFQKNKSTLDAISTLTDHIYDKLNAKQHSVAIFLDLCKAYDTVDHSILLSKLFQYGFRGVTLNWFRSYLSNRRYCVKIGNCISDNKTINISIPQGSILGCTLFSLYISDISYVSNILKPLLFADDTALIHSDSSYNDLITVFNVELEKINLWLLRNRLTLNVEKTVAMVFSNRMHDVNYNSGLILSNKRVNFSRETKYLGVTIDDKLSFGAHINGVCSKVSKNIGVLYRMSFYVPRNVLINVYYSLIYPYLIYCNVVWGGGAAVHINKLLLLQKKCVRIVTSSGYLDHCDPLFYETGILKINLIYNYLSCILAYKRKSLFPEMDHPHNTRNRTAYLVPRFQRLNLSQKSLSYILPFKWNEIPLNVRMSPSLNKFKKCLKSYLLELEAP